MLISINVHLHYTATQPTDVLLQIEPAEGDGQTVSNVELSLYPEGGGACVKGEERIGNRRWLKTDGRFECHYSADVAIDRPGQPLEGLAATPLHALPNDVLKFLMPSRYCHPEVVAPFVAETFGTLNGGALIAALANWITQNFRYDNSVSDASTTAGTSFQKRAGVCRDYAHVLISMARAVGIPARYVSAYGPDVAPMDIHALAEVYLDDRWHLVDPTAMTRASDTVRIGVGRDAADVSFITSFGWLTLEKQTVDVYRITR